MTISFVLLSAETNDMTVKLAIERLVNAPGEQDNALFLWLINTINSSAVMTHKSTIINNVLSQCHHSLTSSRFGCQDVILFSCPCH